MKYCFFSLTYSLWLGCEFCKASDNFRLKLIRLYSKQIRGQRPFQKMPKFWFYWRHVQWHRVGSWRRRLFWLAPFVWCTLSFWWLRQRLAHLAVLCQFLLPKQIQTLLFGFLRRGRRKVLLLFPKLQLSCMVYHDIERTVLPHSKPLISFSTPVKTLETQSITVLK
jgi:hypothetical protein